ncbi:MAG TPA: hypothetical protein VEB22_11220 [Phycisphaerales bacterium]|nr:hypothetical protein [Phycisphaerales bacterium]
MRRFDELSLLAAGAVDAIRLATPDLDAVVIVVERNEHGSVRYAGHTSLKPPSKAAQIMREVRLAWSDDA